MTATFSPFRSSPATDPHRREVLTTIAKTTLAGGLASLPGAAALAQAATPARSDRVALQRAIDSGDCTIARRDTPYLLDGPLFVPGGRTVLIEPLTRFVFTGAPAPGKKVGVFTVKGDRVRIAVVGTGEAVVESMARSTLVYAVLASGIDGLEVADVRAINCQHVCLTTAAASYGEISTRPGSRDVCRHVTILRGGARYDTMPGDGDGACYLGYTLDCTVTGSTYENVCHGVQWWGGNANPGVDGGPGNELKCANFTITDVTVRHASQAGIWGSMGRNGRIVRCRTEWCGDLGFDAEGCDTVVFSDCHAQDATNGCYSTFFFSRNITFSNCTGLSTSHLRPLFRTYNVTQDATHTGLVTVSGGRFECRDATGVGSMDTHSGPVRELVIEGAELINVRIETLFNNMHVARVRNNRLRFPHALTGFAAIRVGGSRTLAKNGRPEIGSAVVEGNSIIFAAAQPTPPAGSSGRVAIEVIEDDYNATANDVVRNNTIAGHFTTAIALRNATGNAGVRPHVLVEGNTLGDRRSRGRPLLLSTAIPAAAPPLVDWKRNRLADGSAVSPGVPLT